MPAAESNRITEQQLELLQSLKHLKNEQSIREVKELLHLYFRHKLDAAIEQEEEQHNYAAEVYEQWLQTCNRDASGIC